MAATFPPDEDYTKLSSPQAKEKLWGWFRTSFFTEFYGDALILVSQMNTRRPDADRLVLILDFSTRHFQIFIMSEYLQLTLDRIPGNRAKELWTNDIRTLVAAIGYIPAPLCRCIKTEGEKRKTLVGVLISNLGDRLRSWMYLTQIKKL